MDQLERLIVKARSAVAGYIPLTPLDIYLGHYVTGGVYFFRRTPDVARMKSALATTLDRHPSFDACMVREAGSIGLKCGETGVELSICRSGEEWPDLRSTESLVTDALLASDDYSNDVNQNYRFNSGGPVARFRLVLFDNGCCALLIQHVHSQGDGSTAIHFLENWARAYRGEALPPGGSYSRAHISGLATLPGLAPSTRLNIVQRMDIESEQTEPWRDRGSIRIDLASATLESFVNDCRRCCRLSLSSSDILHALAWRCFASTQQTIAQRRLRLYTLFDLRGIKSLGIPSDYEGSAVLGRCAELSHEDVCDTSIAELALTLQKQIKPVTAEDVRQDISYLAREYQRGHIDADGHYANFAIGAWLDCRNAGGLIVNDLRRLANADLCFEERPARMETLVSTDINMVSIYPNDDGTITLHYVGDRNTLADFSYQLKAVMGESVARTVPAGAP